MRVLGLPVAFRSYAPRVATDTPRHCWHDLTTDERRKRDEVGRVNDVCCICQGDFCDYERSRLGITDDEPAPL